MVNALVCWLPQCQKRMVVPLPIQLCAYGLEKQRGMTQVLGPLNPAWGTQWLWVAGAYPIIQFCQPAHTPWLGFPFPTTTMGNTASRKETGSTLRETLKVKALRRKGSHGEKGSVTQQDHLLLRQLLSYRITWSPQNQVLSVQICLTPSW